MSDDIIAQYDWADQPAPYCKNLTGISYRYDPTKQSPRVQHWGYNGINQPFTFISIFSFVPYLSFFLLRLNCSAQVDFQIPYIPVYFQYTARSKAMQSKADVDRNRRYVDRFKLYLDEKVAEALPPLPSDTTVVTIISDYLHELYGMAISDIEKTWGGSVKPDNVVWFLTVPAMWSEKAKQDMRKAAVLAGMVRNLFLQRLFFLSLLDTSRE